MKSRSILRAAAKKTYKEQIKKNGTPKNRRMPFSQFFKQYVKLQQSLKANKDPETEANTEDFDFEEMINVEEISDDNVEKS